MIADIKTIKDRLKYAPHAHHIAPLMNALSTLLTKNELQYNNMKRKALGLLLIIGKCHARELQAAIRTTLATAVANTSNPRMLTCCRHSLNELFSQHGFLGSEHISREITLMTAAETATDTIRQWRDAAERYLGRAPIGRLL